MQAINERLKRIKRELKYKAEKEKEVNKKIRRVLVKVLGGILEARYIRGFYLKYNTLFVEAKTKTSANEVFLRRQQILKDLKGLVRDIIVR